MKGWPIAVLVAHGGNSRHFGNQPVCRDFCDASSYRDVERIMIERGKGANDTNHDRHRVGIAIGNPLKNSSKLLVNHGVVA
jgi:hypothetical protein